MSDTTTAQPCPKDAMEADTWRRRLKKTLRSPFWVLSWTWGLANVLKPEHDRDERARIIRLLNLIYFLGSIIIVVGLIVCTGNDLARVRPDSIKWWAIGLQYILLWRFFEVLRAFHHDAFDKLATPDSSSSLTWPERVRLALRSYLELILDFALIYALLPSSAWIQTDKPKPPESVTDVVWYSANVITTSGGGGFVPASIPLKLLSVGEVFAGVILLIVCFTVYVSRALGSPPVPTSTPLDRSAATKRQGATVFTSYASGSLASVSGEWRSGTMRDQTDGDPSNRA